MSDTPNYELMAEWARKAGELCQRGTELTDLLRYVPGADWKKVQLLQKYHDVALYTQDYLEHVKSELQNASPEPPEAA